MNAGNLGRPRLRCLKFKSPPDLADRTPQSSTEQIRQRCVFNGDNLSTAATDGGEDFHESQGAIVINVLNGIIQQKCFPLAPSSGQMDRQQERETSGATLTAAEQELHNGDSARK